MGGKFANGAATAACASIVLEAKYRYGDEYKIAGNCRTRAECGDLSKDPILEMADALETDGEFQYARTHASNTASRLGESHQSNYGVIVKLDRRWYEHLGLAREPGALIDIPGNKYSVTEAFSRTAISPVQPESQGYIMAPAPITSAVSVSIYRYSNSAAVNYFSYAKSANAPVYVQSRGGGCVVYGASSSRGC